MKSPAFDQSPAISSSIPVIIDHCQLHNYDQPKRMHVADWNYNEQYASFEVKLPMNHR